MNLFILFLLNIEIFYPSNFVISKGNLFFTVNPLVFPFKDSLWISDLFVAIEDTGFFNFKIKVYKNLKDKKPIIKQEKKIHIPYLNYNNCGGFENQIVLKGGKYFVFLEFSKKNKRGECLFSIKIPESEENIKISDLILAYGFDKNYAPLINLTNYYKKDATELFYYFEIYFQKPDTKSTYIVVTGIKDLNENIIALSKQHKYKEFFKRIHTGAFKIKGLKPGEYKFFAKIFDLKNKKEYLRETNFLFGNISDIYKKYEGYWDFIDYIAKGNELKIYKKLSGYNKILFLKRFWDRRGGEKAIEEFVNRVKYADEHFKFMKIKGRYTDRGRIYIKYGEPDEIYKATWELGSKDREHWYYYSQKMEFVFVDVDGSGNFRLIYSSREDEPTWPNWYKYIPPEEIRFRK